VLIHDLLAGDIVVARGQALEYRIPDSLQVGEDLRPARLEIRGRTGDFQQSRRLGAVGILLAGPAKDRVVGSLF
jgi:hypothetical protein